MLPQMNPCAPSLGAPRFRSRRVGGVVEAPVVAVHLPRKHRAGLIGFATDGDDGWFKLSEYPYDLAIIDIGLPKMDGLTLIKSLRALPAHIRTPIVVLTTEASDAMKAQGRAAGATGWMVKPFDPNKLLEIAKKVMG